MIDASFISIQIEGLNVNQSMLDIPDTVSIHSIYIREYTYWAVPMLDFILIDMAGILTNSKVYNFSKGAKVTTSVATLKEKSFWDKLVSSGSSTTVETDDKTKLVFRVASIRPQQINSLSNVYQVSCFLESNLLLSKDTWSYTGKMSNSIYDMINPSAPRDALDSSIIPSYITNIDPAKDFMVRFTKPQNMTYARFLRTQVLPSLKEKDGKSYFLYYHSGQNVFLYNVNLLMDEYLALADTDTSSYFVLDKTKVIRTVVELGSYSKEQKSGSNGATVYQYDPDTGEYITTSAGTQTTVDHSVQDTTLTDDRVMFAGVSAGNHPQDFINSSLTSLRTSGLYNHIITVELNYIAPVNGLDIVLFKNNAGAVTPYVVIGKSTIWRNNVLEQHLRLATNSKPDVSSTSAIGTYNVTGSQTELPEKISYNPETYMVTKNGMVYNVDVKVNYADEAKTYPMGGSINIYSPISGASVVYRLIPDNVTTQTQVHSFVTSLGFN